MPYEREHRLDDRMLESGGDELETPASEAVVPGKQTQTLLQDWLARRAIGPIVGRVAAPGKRSLEDYLARAPRLAFHDFQTLALRDVLSRLPSERALHAATLAAADPKVARRVDKRCSPPPVDHSTVSLQGRALWRAAERRAVTLYRRASSTGVVALETPAVAAALASIGSGTPLDPRVCRKCAARWKAFSASDWTECESTPGTLLARRPMLRTPKRLR